MAKSSKVSSQTQGVERVVAETKRLNTAPFSICGTVGSAALESTEWSDRTGGSSLESSLGSSLVPADVLCAWHFQVSITYSDKNNTSAVLKCNRLLKMAERHILHNDSRGSPGRDGSQ